MYEICELIRYGDDERQLALEQLFAKAGVKTCSQAVSASKSTTSRSYLHSCGQSSSLQTILLPVPCDEKTLQQAYEEAPAGSLILGGNLPAAFVKCCQERGLHIYDYMKSSAVAIWNAVATAEGAICEAIRHSPYNLYQHTCLVMGYGRCGKVLADRLTNLGATVIISARSSEKTACAEVSHCLNLTESTDLSTCQWLFNTVPAPIVGKSLIDRLPDTAVIIDLASAPGGCDLTYCAQKGLDAALYPGLPAKYAPKSSAEIILQHLNDIFVIG